MPRTVASFGLLIAGLAFGVLCFVFRSFVLDDAYITLRFAENLKNGYGPVFNPGADPVEGFTSYLWLVLNATALKFGFDPILASRLVAFLSMVAVLLVLARHAALLRVRVVLIVALATSPAAAFLTMQGLETATTGALLLAASAAALRYRARLTVTAASQLVVTAFLALLARPDSAPFLAGLFIGLLIPSQIKTSQRTARLRHFVIPGTIAALAGGVFMIWRVRYFGSWLPNTSSIKFASSQFIGSLEGVLYSLTFIVLFLLPVTLAVLVLARPSRSRLADAFPLGLGLAFHLGYLCTISPLQGFLGRFAFTVYPSALLLLAVVFSQQPKHERAHPAPWVVAALVVFNLSWLPYAKSQMEYRTQIDRVLAGQALRGVDGRLFTSAAGALPYYSGWHSVDRLGLTSEEIAREGVSMELLKRFRPDLVAVTSLLFAQKQTALRDPTVAYLIEHRYQAVTCIRRNERFDFCYFVDPGSPRYQEIIERLTTLPEVRYADAAWLGRKFGIEETGPR